MCTKFKKKIKRSDFVPLGKYTYIGSSKHVVSHIMILLGPLSSYSPNPAYSETGHTLKIPCLVDLKELKSTA